MAAAPAYRRINQLLTRDEECTLAELMQEDDGLVVQCRSQNQKLLEFMTRKENLTKLIQYATQMPENPDNHTESHKYPFMAIDILTSSIRIAKAITEGGYTMDPPEENEDVLCRQPSSDIFGESETNMVQNILNGNKSTSNESKNSDKKEQLVETLDQELGLDSDQQDNEKNKESVAEGEDKEAGEEKQEEKAERSSPDENKEEAEEESEDVDQEENDEGVKIQVSASVQAKKTNLAPEEENKRKESIQEEEQYHDYGILDTIGSFLESDDELQPILCGYFNKLVNFLLNKQKHEVLEYLLLKRDGQIFDNLLRHIKYHSLSLLMTELLATQITPDLNKKKFEVGGMDNDDRSLDENEPELSKDQLTMQTILHEKKMMVIRTLLDKLSNKNQDDFEETLNASNILKEFCDDEQCYAHLVEQENFNRLIEIVCQTNNVQNQAHATQLLSTVLSQFSENGKELSDDKRDQFKQTVSENFKDLIYHCMLVLRSEDEALNPYQNQTTLTIKKIGIRRLRTMELLKNLFTLISKHDEIKEVKKVQNYIVMKRRLIETMLYMIKAFPFCSISNQQAILIMNCLREDFDEEDLQYLKKFVQKELIEQQKFTFPSQNQTNGLNMCQIVQMAFELKNITQKVIDDDSSDAEDEGMEHGADFAQWMQFCQSEIEPIESVWNRRLEDSKESETNKADENSSDDDADRENTLEDMLTKISVRLKGQRNQTHETKSKKDLELEKAIQEAKAEEQKAKDDQERIKEFSDQAFWTLPAQYDVDALLDEME